jgi:hypothetical protein
MLDLPNSDMPVAAYVHLGPNLPKHLKLGLVRHRDLFPEQEIVLIISHDQDFKIPSRVMVHRVNSDELENELFSEMSQKLDFEFRRGFWKYTLQRFFALNDFHKTIPNQPLTHIESDVLVMPNFPWSKFAALERMAWLQVNSELDVAAIVHFPNASYTQILSTEVAKFARANPGTNDMLVLHELARILKPKQFYLPSLNTHVSNSNLERNSQIDENIQYFGGIFDPLILGLWYFGQDPKNSFGLLKRYVGDKSHDLNPERVKLSFTHGELRDQYGVQVFSLHIHSKMLSLFDTNWEKSLKSRLLQAETQKQKYAFSVLSMYASIRSRRARETIWILVAFTPGIQQLRRIRTFEVLKDLFKKLFKI